MKYSIKISALIFRVLKASKGVVLTLVLISLLSYELGLTLNNSATAFPSAYKISSEHTTQVSQSPHPVSNTLPKRIANAILRDASKRSKLQIRDLQITQFTQKTFSNPCIFKFGEVCTREFNPIEGWEVTVEVRNDSWTYHVNKSGSQIVLDPKVNTSQPTALPKAIETSILRDVSKRSKIPIANLKITKVSQKTFSNPCVFKFGEICTQEFNPVKGWEVVVEVGKQSWTYHVNESGSQVVLDPKVSTARG